jgi:hypothetical protein
LDAYTVKESIFLTLNLVQSSTTLFVHQIVVRKKMVLLPHSRNCSNKKLPSPGKYDRNAEDTQRLEHVNEHVPVVTLHTANGAKLQLTTIVFISTPHAVVHSKEV